MKKTLMEAYAKRIAFAESLYKEERGCAMPQAKKSIIAQILNNTNKVLTEAFASTAATQTANIGGVNAPVSEMKKFCLDVANIALPNLILLDLVITKPMTSEYGTLRYLKFVAGVDKGGVEAGQPFNEAFRLGKMDAARAAYTSNSVVETFDAEAETIKLSWAQGAQIAKAFDAEGNEMSLEGVEIAKDGTVTGLDGAVKIAYTYDNVIIPQDKIPTITAKFDVINLQAKARRIAIYYSTLAQYTYKVESGEDLGAKLKEQAMSEIQYEIDNEGLDLLEDLAFAEDNPNEVQVFYKKKPVGINLREHYMAFLSTLEEASTQIYNTTQKYAANAVVLGSAFKPILTMIEGFKANEIKPGPYYCGQVAGLKVYISPRLGNKGYVLFNNNDLVASPAVFAPFMVCTPTMLLEMPDNAAMQGFATLYDLKPLNKFLVCGIELNTTDVDPIYIAEA